VLRSQETWQTLTLGELRVSLGVGALAILRPGSVIIQGQERGWAGAIGSSGIPGPLSLVKLIGPPSPPTSAVLEGTATVVDGLPR
jgi:hypothetical protein